MRINKPLLAMYVSIIILGMTSFWMQTVMHERTHKQIGIYSGAGECNITYTWDGGYTRCGNYNQTEAMGLQEIALHSQNEIVGYNVEVFIVLWVGGILLLCVLYLSINNKPEHYIVLFEKKKTNPEIVTVDELIKSAEERRRRI